jgi:hypothetical protein
VCNMRFGALDDGFHVVRQNRNVWKDEILMLHDDNVLFQLHRQPVPAELGVRRRASLGP